MENDWLYEFQRYIKKFAEIGDLIALSVCLPKDDNKDIIIINVTRRADNE